MLILLDEGGEFMFDRRGHAKLRTWLSSNRVTFTQKGCMGVEMNDFACLIALTNEIMSIRVEARGDARSVPIAVNEGYSLASAEAGSIVDGEPMTIDRRKLLLPRRRQVLAFARDWYLCAASVPG